ncbi:condensation domain-containing protein [Burkholderia sp. Tr-862]|uniref:condensation domain-containing protein n=1 Tax=Burkholderia sp. Tr-862 TaxID=2608331 RepID=UPI001FFDBF97|nr:condensation domain-containing protein [Burkholderia sp. Tr-862]
MVAEIDRRFAPDAWQAAFQALQHRHPLLSTCIAIDAQQHSGFYRVTDAAVPLRVLEQDPTAWQAEAAHEIATRFVGSAAPLLRATLLQGECSSTLILVAHHSVVDGMGSASLIDDLLRSCRASDRGRCRWCRRWRPCLIPILTTPPSCRPPRRRPHPSHFVRTPRKRRMSTPLRFPPTSPAGSWSAHVPSKPPCMARLPRPFTKPAGVCPARGPNAR